MLPSSPPRRTLFCTPTLRARELDASDLPALQTLFVANPEYFIAVNGMPARDDEAQQEFADRPPPSMPYDRQIMIGLHDDTGQLVAMATVVSNLLAAQVWHIGLFIVATSLHGSGLASLIYQSLEQWMKAQGAQWIRLGAVVGNLRAERFWEKMGYTEVRQRTDVPSGRQTNTLRVMVKPVGVRSLAQYLDLVARDRPDAGQA